MSRPSVFIASTSEQLVLANEIGHGISSVADWHVWNTLTRASAYLIETLTEEALKADFGVFLLTGDDAVIHRDNTTLSPRDNVVFELGLFMGVIGRQRCFLLAGSNARIPLDLDGIQRVPLSPVPDACYAISQEIVRQRRRAHDGRYYTGVEESELLEALTAGGGERPMRPWIRPGLRDDVGQRVDQFAALAADAAGVLMANRPKDALFRRDIHRLVPAYASSILWNSSFVADHALRSRLLGDRFGDWWRETVNALFAIEPAASFRARLDVGELYSTPRSFPHLVSLMLPQLDSERQLELARRVAARYSPNSVGFHEAEYVTLQVLSMLLFHAPRLGGETMDVIAAYLSESLTAIEGVLDQNAFHFCNEHFEKKYNILLLRFVAEAIEELEGRAGAALQAQGVRYGRLDEIRRAVVPRIFAADAIEDLSEETEYLVYLLDYVAFCAVRGAGEVAWRMLANLVDELSARYQKGKGLMVTRRIEKRFNFHLPLAVRAYERLLGSTEP